MGALRYVASEVAPAASGRLSVADALSSRGPRLIYHPFAVDCATSLPSASQTVRRLGFYEQPTGKRGGVIVAASTVAIVAIAAVIIVALIALIYIVPRGGRRRR
jgi:hypothetical protein